jgi:hypothetical protein
MQYYLTTTPGLRKLISKAGTNAPVVTTVQQATKKWQRLWNISSVNGNRKAPNPQSYQKDESNWYDGAIGYYALNGQSFNEIRGCHSEATYSMTNPVLVNNVYNDCLSRIYDQIRGQVDLAMNAAEFGELIALKRKCEKLETIILKNDLDPITRELRRRFKKGVVKPLMKDVGSLWLLWQFGIKPLVQDVYNAASEVQKALPSKLVTRARAGQTQTVKIDRVWPGDSNVREVGVVEHSVRVQMDIHWMINPTVLQKIGNWTSLNPATIVWEKFPWSFLVDYVYDIGGYMRNLESALLYKSNFQSGYSTTTTLSSGRTQANANKVVGSAQLIASLTSSRRIATKQRSPLSAAPTPRTPRFEADLGSTRLLNIAALLTNALK